MDAPTSNAPAAPPPPPPPPDRSSLQYQVTVAARQTRSSLADPPAAPPSWRERPGELRLALRTTGRLVLSFGLFADQSLALSAAPLGRVGYCASGDARRVVWCPASSDPGQPADQQHALLHQYSLCFEHAASARDFYGAVLAHGAVAVKLYSKFELEGARSWLARLPARPLPSPSPPPHQSAPPSRTPPTSRPRSARPARAARARCRCVHLLPPHLRNTPLTLVSSLVRHSLRSTPRLASRARRSSP